MPPRSSSPICERSLDLTVIGIGRRDIPQCSSKHFHMEAFSRTFSGGQRPRVRRTVGHFSFSRGRYHLAGTKLLPEPLIYLGRRECLRIEQTPPLKHVVMFFVFGIGQDRQVFFIAGRSSYVFWGSAAFAADARRILRGCLRQQDGLQHQVMIPAVTEVIQICELSPHTGHDLPERHAAFIDHLALVHGVVGVGHAVKTAADHELVEMVILPAHDDLQDGVQLGQGSVFPHLDAPPDRRVNVPQCYVQLIQRSSLRHDYILLIARMRRTEVRPIPNRRAISALLMPARCSFRTCSAWNPAVMGRPNFLPFCRAWARPARTRSRRISRSNSANTASNAAMARPAGVVRSSASVSETKPTPRCCSSWRVASRSATDRPHRSKRHTSTTSISRRRAASSNFSRSCRSEAPLPTSLTCKAIVEPRRAAYSRRARICNGMVCWSFVETRA